MGAEAPKALREKFCRLELLPSLFEMAVALLGRRGLRREGVDVSGILFSEVSKPTERSTAGGD